MAAAGGSWQSKFVWQWVGICLLLLVLLLFLVPLGSDNSEYGDSDVACNAVAEGLVPGLYADGPDGEYSYLADSAACAARRTAVVGLGGLLLVPATLALVLALRPEQSPEHEEPDTPDDRT